MGLEDFEKELAAAKVEESHSSRKRHRSRSRSRDRRRDGKDEERRHRHHHHHHRSSRHREDDSKDQDRRSHSRRHHRRDRDAGADDAHALDQSHQRKRRRSNSPSTKTSDTMRNDGEDEWVEKEATPEEQKEEKPALKRDNWMEAPSSLDIDYVQRSKVPKEPPSQFVSAKEDSPNNQMEQIPNNTETRDTEESNHDESAHHEVSYTFGDSGSQWRMTKLRGVYRKAEESGMTVEEVALKSYGSLRDFDDAREEERELDRKSMYGKDYAGLEKPSGNLFLERQQKTAAQERNKTSLESSRVAAEPQIMSEAPPPARTMPLDQTALNKLKAQMMKAKLRKAPNAAQLEAEYEAAATAAAANTVQPDVIVLNAAENRMLAGGRGGEVLSVDNKRGRERGTVVENEDMTIEDMVRQEKRTRGQFGGEGRAFAERIAKDGKFTDNLDYMDENAAKLARNMAKSDMNLRNTAIGDFQRMQKVLDNCPLCHHEDTNTPPAAPVVSLATRVYMTLPTEPEVATGGAVIVPIQHHLNLLECDDDEWEEIRNFMKSLTRMYHERDRGVIFYENAAHMNSRKGHAALFAVPLPFHLAENAPAYFKEAILGADEEWSQHKKVIDTLAKSQQPGFGKQAFRKSLVKQMAYFHVWFTVDGGLGHVIEDDRRWPKGDLFAREIIGGMLGKGPDVIKKQGRWTRQDSRVDGFRKRWNQFDWTRVLYDAQ